MVALIGVTSVPPVLLPAWGSGGSAGNAGGNAPATLTADQASAQVARNGVTRAAAQLASDQAPRGTPATLEADQEAVKAAEQAAAKAAAKLNADQTGGVDVLA